MSENSGYELIAQEKQIIFLNSSQSGSNESPKLKFFILCICSILHFLSFLFFVRLKFSNLLLNATSFIVHSHFLSNLIVFPIEAPRF